MILQTKAKQPQNVAAARRFQLTPVSPRSALFRRFRRIGTQNLAVSRQILGCGTENLATIAATPERTVA